MLGVAAVTVASWYWLSYTDSGIKNLTNAILLLIVFCALIPKLRREAIPIFKREFRRDLVPIIFSSTTYLFCGRYLFLNFGFTVGSNNADVAAYAQISNFLSQNGFNGSGNLVGLPAGVIARTDVTGTYSLISFIDAVLRVPIHQALNICLLFAFVMIAICAKRILSVLGIEGISANIIAVLPQSTFMMAYLSWSFFLSQLIGAGFMLAIFVVMISQLSRVCLSRISVFQTAILYSILVSGLVMAYGHMALVVIPLTIVTTFLRVLKGGGFSMLLAPIVGGFFGFVFVYSKSLLVLQKALAFAGDSTNGWKLPFFLPSELLGFQWTENGKPTGSDFDLSLLLIAVFLIALFCLFSTGDLFEFAPILVYVTFVGVGYIYFISKGTDSYLQWKWITFFLPLIVVTFFAVLSQAWSRGIISFSITPILCFFLVFNLAHFDRYSIPGRYGSPVTSDQFKLPQELDIFELEAINIKSGPYPLSMWPAVYLSDLKMTILDASYYSTIQPLVAPTLVSTNFPLIPNVKRHKINSTYDLIDARTDHSKFLLSTAKTTINLNDLPSEFSLDESIPLNVTITNRGESSWSGSGSFNGAVNLGIRTMSRNDVDYSVELAHCPIVEFPNYVSPGMSIEVSCPVTFTESGNFEIEITPVSEGEGWFSDVVPDNRFVAIVKVGDL
jgi:hypothetical protein